ncbi:hypothetical protein F5141DRAFT_1066639 [Pisolithus sp. B1]|nr:hypothetical protein F5141DRAFT_1066639 [Pisolithus sp. B1]
MDGDHPVDTPHLSPGPDVEMDNGIQAAFIGPGNNLYCNYHPSLTGQPSNANGDFLLTGTQLEPHQPKPPVEAGSHLICSLHTEMYQTIDNTQIGDVKWESFTVKYTADAEVDPAPWMHNEYNVWFQDPHKVVQNMLENPKFAKEMNYQPFSTRQSDYYPLYLSIGNICNNVCQAHHNGVTLITFLAMPKTRREHTGKDSFCKCWCQLFHSSLGCILKTFKPGIVKPEVIPFGDGHHCHVVYGIGLYIADYEEQALLTCIVHNWCPHLATLWDEYGAVAQTMVPMFLEMDLSVGAKELFPAPDRP